MENGLNILICIVSTIVHVVLQIIIKCKIITSFMSIKSKEIKIFLIFTGLIFYPITLLICYFATYKIGTLFLGEASLTFYGQLIVWIVALLLCGFIFLRNLRDYLLYKKRCFYSIIEWFYEERYSLARRKAMYPPIRKVLLSKDVIGICIGKIGIGIFKKYICIDLNNKQIANHIVIIGNSSAGKSSGPILTSLISNFIDCDENTPPDNVYLVVDPKPELCRLSTSGGKWTRMLNPTAKRGTSFGWNLYYDIDQNSSMDKITNRIESIVAVIVQDSNADNAFFQDSARNLLSGALIYEFVAYGNNFIKAIHNILSVDLDVYVKKIKKDSKCPKKVLMLLSEFGNPEDKSNATKDIKKSLKQQTAVFTRSDTEWFLDSDVNKLMCSPYCLDEFISMFLSIKRADLARFGVVFRLIISQCSEHLSRREDDNPTDKPVVIIIDEFTNLGGTIPNYCENLGFIRAKKVTYITIFQQYSQLQKLYGKEEARTIINMGHQVILSGEDTELGKVFSDKGGEFTDIKASYKQMGRIFHFSSAEKTVSQTKERRIRVMDDLISLYPRFESIAFINGSEYIRFGKCRYFLEPKLSKRSQECQRFHQLIEAGSTLEMED